MCNYKTGMNVYNYIFMRINKGNNYVSTESLPSYSGSTKILHHVLSILISFPGEFIFCETF